MEKKVNIIYVICFVVVLLFLIKKLSRNKDNTKLFYKYTTKELTNHIAESDQVAFKSALLAGCEELNIKPIDLLSVMFSESGLKYNAYNENGGASGIFQFIPSTAKSLGTSTAAIRTMKASTQLKYVFKYLRQFKGKIKTAFDIYLVTFFPVALGKPDSFIFKTKNISSSQVAKNNKAIDFNDDNKITKAEFKKWFKKRIFK
jgi:hypothetical protein